ncbi:MAG: hypothetical protein AAF637_13045 [Pseudomonadota bacterium]
MRTALTIIVLFALLAASAGVALWAWQQLGDVEISNHGLIALGLGAGVTFVLGAGLMALVFFSNRRGYDDQAHRHDSQVAPRRAKPTRRKPL